MLRSFARTCLLLFASESPAYGYELVERLEELGVSASDPGTVYRSLHCLEEQGLLESGWHPSDQGGPARRDYVITGRGMAALHADTEALRRDERALTAFLARYERLYQSGLSRSDEDVLASRAPRFSRAAPPPPRARP